jgi:hypothetical protein
MMVDDRLSIVTPSFKRDLALCRTLNRSILEFFPAHVHHYIVVDRRDVALFRPLAGSRTTIIEKEDVLPAGMRRLPGFNRWRCSGTLVPISGWLVQQIVKISMSALLDVPTLLMVDSDVAFVRDIDLRLFAAGGKTRLYKNAGAILGKTPAMEFHLTWHENAAKLLGIPAAPLPLDDYIGQVISWRRDLVLGMCRRIEEVTSTSWFQAIARALAVSEYLLYGVYVDRIAGNSSVWIDDHARCNSYWEDFPVAFDAVRDHVASLDRDDLALMISSHSRTAPDVRSLILRCATNGRLS